MTSSLIVLDVPAWPAGVAHCARRRLAHPSFRLPTEANLNAGQSRLLQYCTCL